MAHLTVSVSGPWQESKLLTLPVDVHAPDGTILASGIASPEQPARLALRIPPGQNPDRVHVLGKLPNGLMLQQTATLHGGEAEAVLHLADESPREWLQWVTPFHSLRHLLPESNSGAGWRWSLPVLLNNQSGVAVARRIGKVWMTLWAWREGRWVAEAVRPVERQRDLGMQQIVIDVPRTPHLLQIGGEEVAWRLVSLPPGGPVRVALTRSPAEEGDTLDITVGRAEPDNELIMSYLARGAIAEADRLAGAWDAADVMLYEKKRDPVSAAAGAYLLLKSRRLQDRRRWVDNLVEWFPYLADGPIISAALALQREDATENEVRAKLAAALKRGLPVFAMGATVLVETMAAVHRGKKETKRFHGAFLAAQAYARACCSRGAYFAFYGKSPAEPSWTPIYGVEGEASTSPASAKPAEAVVYTRPWHGVQVGKFGATRVALPRAPVSETVVKALRAEVPGPEGERPGQEMRWPNEPPAAAEPLFRRTVELGIPVVETSFLREFSVGSERGIARVASQAPVRPRENVVIDRKQPRLTKRAPRQTSKYWRDERVKHSMPVFDGDE